MTLSKKIKDAVDASLDDDVVTGIGCAKPRMSWKIIKTQGTKNSVGAFMIYDSDNDEYLFDAEGNNAWDTNEQALAVLNIMTDTEYLQFQDDFYDLLEKYGVKQVDCEHPHWDAICKERNNTIELIDKLKEVA